MGRNESFLCDDNIALNNDHYYWQFLQRPRFSLGKYRYDVVLVKRSGNTDNVYGSEHKGNMIPFFMRIIDLFPNYTLESLSLN